MYILQYEMVYQVTPEKFIINFIYSNLDIIFDLSIYKGLPFTLSFLKYYRLCSLCIDYVNSSSTS